MEYIQLKMGPQCKRMLKYKITYIVREDRKQQLQITAILTVTDDG
jgi:hypothetical protein